MIEDYVAEPSTRASLAQLLGAADALAEQIREESVSHGLPCGSETIVAALVEEGAQLLLVQLAILRVGCAFLLIDLALPQARRDFLLRDTGAALLIVTSDPPNGDTFAGVRHICTTVPSFSMSSQTQMQGRSSEPAIQPSVDALLSQPSSLLYVCYTSGSTGLPKGVAVTQGHLKAYARANAQRHGICESSRVLLASAVSFDPSIGEAWTALLAHSTLCLPSRVAVKTSLGRLLHATAATHVCSTPALWTTLDVSPASLPSLRCVTLGGERTTAHIITRWAGTDTHSCLYNVYGVTECTVYQTSHHIILPASDITASSRAEDIEQQGTLLGEALNGCTVQLLDANLVPLPPTVRVTTHADDTPDATQGQIAIGGAQVARGYLHRPELTAERYVAATGGAEGGGRWYLTGDIGQRVVGPAGGPPIIRLLGRVDSQVKINGIRLELGEVEGVLARCVPLVAHAAAVVHRDRLVGVAEVHGKAATAPPFVREATIAMLLLHARRWLPAAVCPSSIVLLRRMPLTPTGKLDRKAIKDELDMEEARATQEGDGASGDGAAAVASDVHPTGALECAVAKVWKDVLGVPRVSRRSDFLRLGGDSIKALQVTRTLAFSMDHSHHAPPSRGQIHEGVVEEADYGVLRGVFSPGALLRLPLLYRYCEYLRSHDVRAPREEDENAEGGASGDSQETVLADEVVPVPVAPVGRDGADPPSSDAPTHGMDGMITPSFDAVALEARASEEAEVHEEMLRLRSEMLGNKELEQPALQLALCIAARADDRPLATTALKLGANPAPRPLAKLRGGSVANEHGLPPLHMAVREGHAAMVQMLLDASAPPTLLSTAGMPPLILAAQSDRSLAALDLLLSAGASLAMRDDRRQTALHAAARTGAVAALQRLLVAAKEAEAAAEKSATYRTNKEPIIELRDRWHRTALHWAVVNQQAATIGLLVDAGANVDGVHVPRRKHNRATSLPLEAPLHTASRLPPDAALPLIRQLLEAKADPNRRDQFGQTPLHVAAVSSALEPCAAGRACSVVISEVAPPTATDATTVAVEALLNGGADKSCKDMSGRTAYTTLLEQHGDGAPSQVAVLLQVPSAQPS